MWDVYYLNEYAVSMQLHGDGEPCLIYHEDGGKRLAYVMMKNDIGDFKPLSKIIPLKRYYDWTTPYGYGGPLTEGEISNIWIKDFMDELMLWCQKHGVVSQFFRFHPLLQNQIVMESVSDVIYMKKTVYIDTRNEEIIMQNMTSNNRNMVRKAKKNGIEIIIDNGERLEKFINIYEATMKRNEAEEYYYFNKAHFEYLIEEMKDNIIFFYAVYQGKIVSTSIFLYNQDYMHYHLSGTLPDYRSLAATNLLLSQAADWAVEHRIGKFHLGGGVGMEDSLLSFKKHFNRKGLIDFCIGRNIFDKEVFWKLVELRKRKDQTFDDTKPFLIKYRG